MFQKEILNQDLVQLIKGLLPSSSKMGWTVLQHYVTDFEKLYDKASGVSDSYNARINACER